MLKWADETRRRLNSSCELDSIGSSADLISNSSSLSLVDLSSKKVTPVLQKRLKARTKARPQSLYVSPEQITLDVEFSDDTLSNRSSSTVDLHKLSTQASSSTPIKTSSTPSTPEIGGRLTFRRSSVTSLPSESCADVMRGGKTKTKSASTSGSPGDVLKITTKPELLRISTSDNQDRNSHSFWKHLMNKKSWPTAKSNKKYIQKSTSLTEPQTYRKKEGSPAVTPIDVDNVDISLGLADMVCSCDLPMSNSNVNRKTSLRELKRRSAIKKPKRFSKSMDSDRRSCDRSPDSGYSDNRFSSVSSALGSSDDETPPTSPPISIKSTTQDLQAFLKNINESLRNMKVVEQT